MAAIVATVSCKKDDTNGSVITTEITSFYLKNDSIEGLEDIIFTIDNDSNVISNSDSAEYGLRVDSAWPIIGSGAMGSIVIYHGEDSLYYSREDTMYLDFSKPVKIHTISVDGEQDRMYTVNVKVHQVDPDTIVWRSIETQIYEEDPTSEKAIYVGDEIKLLVVSDRVRCYTSSDAKNWEESEAQGLPTTFNADMTIGSDTRLYYGEGDKLYSSNDGATWEESTLTGIEIKNMLFYMDGYLYAYATMEGEDCIARCAEDSTAWEYSSRIPTRFPVTGAGVCVENGPTGKPRAFLVGGRDAGGNLLSTLWSTEDGSYWANLTLGGEWFSPREGVALVQYAGGLMMFGGQDANGICEEDFQLYSPDYGLTWRTPDSKALISIPYANKYYISPITLSDGFIYLIGGRRNGEFAKSAISGVCYGSLPGFIR